MQFFGPFSIYIYGYFFFHIFNPRCNVCGERDCRIFHILIKYQLVIRTLRVLIATGQPNNTAIRVAQEEKGFRRRTRENDERTERLRTCAHAHVGAHAAPATRRRARTCTGPLAARKPQSGRSMTTSLSLSHARCVLVRFTVGMVSPLSISTSPPLFLAL